MLLRASGEHDGVDVGLEGLVGGDATASGVAHAALLIEHAESVHAGEVARAAGVRARIRRELGDAALVDCAAVVGIFEAVVRIADATGIPLEPYKAELSADLRSSLGIDRFQPSPR